MIFYKNLKSHKTTTEKNLVFSIFSDGLNADEDDSVGKPADAKLFYNLTPHDGALKTGLGFEDLSVPSSITDLDTVHTFDFASSIDEIQGIWLYRWYNDAYQQYYSMITMMDSSYTVFGVFLIDFANGYVFNRSDVLSSYPTYQCTYRLDGEDCDLMFTSEGMLCTSTSVLTFYEDVPALSSCVVHYDNFFGITNANKKVLVHSTNTDVRQLTESDFSTIGFNDDRGAITKLVTFNDYVYLFREYGITKLSIYTSKSDFSLAHLFTSTSKIYENSVAICGENILFATREGLYAFNGSSVSKVAEDYNKFWRALDNTNCSAAALDGKYYLATKCDFADGALVGCESGDYVNNVVFEVDAEDYSVNVYRGIDVRKLLAVNIPYINKLCACFYNDYKQHIGQLVTSGKTFTVSTEKCWTSYQTDLSYPAKRKRMKQLEITGLYDVDVEISSDEETKTYSISGSEKEQSIPLCICGKTFQFSFKTSEQYCDVKKPMIVFDCIS